MGEQRLTFVKRLALSAQYAFCNFILIRQFPAQPECGANAEMIMQIELALFLSTFATLLAIINPLEVLPVFLQLLSGKDQATQRFVAWKACLYAMLLCFFFLFLGNLVLRLFGVPLSMVRIVGGIILMKIGFELFSPSASKGSLVPAGGAPDDSNIAFVPLALPLMCGPGAIATILGMTATVKDSQAEIRSYIAVSAAIVATMSVTYLSLAFAPKLTEKLGRMGIDATTRIVGFFVSAMGVGLIFNGVIEALEMHGMTSLH
jgi:multiple antibiotic resistance protein